ncbi:MAG: Uma2 family endonuclease [Thermoguttaceae bacterium]|jgi:Uma2 family endonuclease
MSLVTESHHPPVSLLAPVVDVASAADASLFSHWRWSVEKYHEMVRAGVLDEDDPVELLEGWIVEKMAKSPLHRKVTHSLRKALEHCVPEGWYVDSQEPVALANSEPGPDAVVVRGNSDDFGERHPGPGDVALVAEVTDSNLP